jgi:hypothetical protein
LVDLVPLGGGTHRVGRERRGEAHRASAAIDWQACRLLCRGPHPCQCHSIRPGPPSEQPMNTAARHGVVGNCGLPCRHELPGFDAPDGPATSQISSLSPRILSPFFLPSPHVRTLLAANPLLTFLLFLWCVHQGVQIWYLSLFARSSYYCGGFVVPLPNPPVLASLLQV